MSLSVELSATLEWDRFPPQSSQPPTNDKQQRQRRKRRTHTTNSHHTHTHIRLRAAHPLSPCLPTRLPRHWFPSRCRAPSRFTSPPHTAHQRANTAKPSNDNQFETIELEHEIRPIGSSLSLSPSLSRSSLFLLCLIRPPFPSFLLLMFSFVAKRAFKSVNNSSSSDQPDKSGGVSWQEFNFPPCVTVVHFDPAGDPIPQIAKKTIFRMKYMWLLACGILILNRQRQHTLCIAKGECHGVTFACITCSYVCGVCPSPLSAHVTQSLPPSHSWRRDPTPK